MGQAYAAQQQGAEVTAADLDGTSAAVPTDLRAYATTVTTVAARLRARAATVGYDGLRAEVAFPRELTAPEREGRLRNGADPETINGARVGVTEPYPVQELIALVAPDDAAQQGVARSLVAGDFSQAVAQAFAEADSSRLDLLASHPELASYLVPGGAPDVIAGDTALAVLQEHFATLDTAADGGDPDDNVSTDDLEAAGNESLPPELRAAARYLLDNPTLHGLVDTGADRSGPSPPTATSPPRTLRRS